MNTNFWHVWTMTIALLAAAGTAHVYGLHTYLLNNDITRITLIIPGIALVVSIMSLFIIGKKMYNGALVKQVEFAIDHFTALGLLGTVVGLVFMIRNGIPEPTDLLIGTGTALLTTLVGITFTIYGNQLLLQIGEGERRAQSQ